MALLLAAPVLWWMRDGEFLGLPKAYQTAHGEQTVVRFPDGTELRLNTDSAVTVGTPAASGLSRLRVVRRSSRWRETTTGAFGSRLAMYMLSLWEPNSTATECPTRQS